MVSPFRYRTYQSIISIDPYLHNSYSLRTNYYKERDKWKLRIVQSKYRWLFCSYRSLSVESFSKVFPIGRELIAMLLFSIVCHRKCYAFNKCVGAVSTAAPQNNHSQLIEIESHLSWTIFQGQFLAMCYEFMIFEVLYGYKTRMCLRLQLIHRQKLIVPHYYVFQFCIVVISVVFVISTQQFSSK